MSKIKVEMVGSTLCLSNELFNLQFAHDAGGFPSYLGFTDEPPLLQTDISLLSALYNKRLIRPFLPEGYNAGIIEYDEKYELVFDLLPWQFDDDKTIVPGFEISLSYEVFTDGVVFVRTMFFANTMDDFQLENFALEPQIKLQPDEDANWAYWTFPREYSAALIQNLGNFERNLSMEEHRTGTDEIFPFVSIDFGAEGRRDRHLEFFVEGWNSLTPRYNNTATKVIWQDKRCGMSWNFHRTDAKNPGRALYWNNTWGWALTRAPIERKNNPLRIVHYLDNFKHIPEISVVDQVAEEGANLFILHECWRADAKNGAIPAVSTEKLRGFIERCHQHDIRVALYVRGNEDLMKDGFGEDLFRFLTPDYDGIYMDFGSPCCYLEQEEYYPGGRIRFRSYDKTMRRVRQKIGDDALFIGHSGSFFCAAGYTKLDAYLGGEQEKGKLLENPTVHSYFSGISIQQSSLWTAAFPTYRTKQVLPFMATAMQYPFVHLGVQLPCSSLAHPEVISAVPFARPLWRLWELFDGLEKYNVYSTVNSGGIFNLDSPDTGACLMVAPDGSKLLIASNYSDTPRCIKITIDYINSHVGSDIACFKLDSNYQANSYVKIILPKAFEAGLKGSGITAWLLTAEPEKWQEKLKKFTRPYPTFPEEEQLNTERIETIRKLRFDAAPQEKAFLRLNLFAYPDTYEDSLVVDLYANDTELLDLTNPDKPESLGFITMDGLKKAPDVDRRIPAGGTTPPIPLHKILIKAQPGEKMRLGLQSCRGEHEFYSFVEGTITDENGNVRNIIYDNELDLNWSLLTFDLTLK
jgi:hypothetical protein